jgi:hypothetical protein
MNETAGQMVFERISAVQSHFLAADHGTRAGQLCFIHRGKKKNVETQQVSCALDARNVLVHSGFGR